MAESGTNWARASGSLVIILLLLGLVGFQLLASEEQPQLLNRRSLKQSVRRFLFNDILYVLNSTYDVNTTSVTVVGTVTGPNASVTGYWSTRGRQILDFYGKEVFFSGVSWNGLENIDGAPHGLWARSWQSMLDQMVGLNLNVLRLPFSGSILAGTYMPQNINYYANPDLRNLTSLHIMDVIVRGAGARGMKVILDYHRLNAGYQHEWGLWYDANTSETLWINNWLLVVDRYKNDSTVVGVGLFNEPHHDEAKPPGHLGPEWAPDGVNATINWRTSAIRCANAIHRVNPHLLIAVQGLDVYRGQYGLWGGVFLGQLDAPLNLTVPNKLIFETHDLGPSTFNQSYYNAPDFPSNLPAQWDRMWGFLWDRNMTPVWVGEFGAKFDPYCTSDLCAVIYKQEQLWLGELVRYIQNKSLPWTWWSWDPTSADTGGLLADDLRTLRADKYAYIQNLTYPDFSVRNATTALPTGIRTSGS